MATIATPFKPTIDGFGQLTLRAAQAQHDILTGAWDCVRPFKPSRNMMIDIGFVAACVVAMTGLLAFDQSAFAYHDLPTYYGGVAIDVD